MRRDFIKYIILGALVLFTPISLMLGRWRRSARSYQWKDTPGENIPLPEEVRGQVGSEACASSDGKIIVAAGNRIIPQNIFEEGKDAREDALILLCYKYFIYKSKTFGKDFECVYRSPRPGVVASMALSPVNPHRLAFIVAEFQTIVPEVDELSRMASDPKNRAELAKEYAMALNMKDLHVTVRILDTEKKSPPNTLCTLDNYPMEQLDDGSMLDHWEIRKQREKEMRSITWTSDGNAILVTDRLSVSKIDLSGNRSPLYTPEDVLVISNLCCHTNGDVTLVEITRKDERVYLVRLDQNGNVIARTRGAFTYSGTLPFDEPVFVLIGENKILTACNKPESMHGAFLRVSSLPPNTTDWKETVDWKDHAKTYDIHDPNSVQFYYMPQALINDGNEVLLLKRRAHILFQANEYPNWEATPYIAENAAAPWVELRKMKIS